MAGFVVIQNECRKEFSFSERMDWAKNLERIEKIKANKRMLNPTQNSSETGLKE